MTETPNQPDPSAGRHRPPTTGHGPPMPPQRQPPRPPSAQWGPPIGPTPQPPGPPAASLDRSPPRWHPPIQTPSAPGPRWQATGLGRPDPNAAAPRRRIDVGRLISGAILAGLGGAVARAVLDRSYTAYVRPFMRLPLALAALVLVAAGLAGCVSGLRPAAGGPPRDEHGHGHGHRVPGAALIALVPLAVLAVLRPPALDDAATDSVAPAAYQPQQQSGTQVQPLPGDPDVPKAITFNELTIRANAGNGPPTLHGRMLSLEGFTAKDQSGSPAGTVRVGRYMIWCCAADATFGQAFVRWPSNTPAPAAAAWFRITGRVQDVRTVDTVAVPIIDAQHAQPEPPPAHLYEY